MKKLVVFFKNLPAHCKKEKYEEKQTAFFMLLVTYLTGTEVLKPLVIDMAKKRRFFCCKSLCLDYEEQLIFKEVLIKID